MGQEIATSHFSDLDFCRFREKLAQETALVAQWFGQQHFVRHDEVAGMELEAWLVDKNFAPAPWNERYLTAMADPLMVPELAQFNVELNSSPQPLVGNALRRMYHELTQTWAHGTAVAQTLGAELVMIGILPTVQQSELCLKHMSPLVRYRALNEQMLRLRQSQPIRLQIQGREVLNTVHDDLMVEAAATSFQVHLQVNPEQAVRFYNAAHILSAPMVAVAANSPYLFGRDLWAETRIPLFEQAVSGCSTEAHLQRVTFGTGYAEDSLLECFQENQALYPILLPMCTEDTATDERLNHLRLHNGTIWRWNRPLIGFESDGKPHLRLEHRVIPAGPSVVDNIANAALFYGLIQVLATQESAPEYQLNFATARNNFYTAAQHGLAAQIRWLDGKIWPVDLLLKEKLLPLAYQGLDLLGLDAVDRDYFLGIMAARLMTGQNGTVWQRNFVQKYGTNMHELTRVYLKHQKSGAAVHEWDG